MITHNPLHRSGQARLTHPAPALGDDAKSSQGIRMADLCQWKPAVSEATHTVPGNLGVLAPTQKCSVPQPSNLGAKDVECSDIARDSEISDVSTRSALIRAGIAVRKRQEKGRSSNPRYGSKAIKGHWANDVAEQKIIRTVVEMLNDGISFSKIAKFLTGAGVPTKTRRKKWHPEVVRQIYLVGFFWLQTS